MVEPLEKAGWFPASLKVCREDGGSVWGQLALEGRLDWLRVVYQNEVCALLFLTICDEREDRHRERLYSGFSDCRGPLLTVNDYAGAFVEIRDLRELQASLVAPPLARLPLVGNKLNPRVEANNDRVGDDRLRGRQVVPDAVDVLPLFCSLMAGEIPLSIAPGVGYACELRKKFAFQRELVDFPSFGLPNTNGRKFSR